ncbi:MAG: 8-oxoguanine DNA glycosylase [Clostridia bacterium]|nr:8-oxoguanine DNA glycosylase [Clostridia bacterium]
MLFKKKTSNENITAITPEHLTITEEGERRIRVSGIDHFDLRHTFDCGQCFRWNRVPADGSYTGVVDDKIINISQKFDGSFVFDNCTPDEFRDFWFDYLDLGRDYGTIIETLNRDDDVMKTATGYGSGIRLLRQDMWETLISFIISQNSNIPRIKKSIEALCKISGRPLGKYKGDEYYAFPSPERISGLTIEDLDSCGLGYRSRYILDTAKTVAEDVSIELNRMRDVPLKEAEEYITSLNGVGPKVANCFLLFGAWHYEAFPIDVWMKRIMTELYGFRENDLKGMQKYAADHFGKYSGFAQQYLFFYARENL